MFSRRPTNKTRSSSRDVIIRAPFSVAYFSRGTLPKKDLQKGTTGGPRKKTGRTHLEDRLLRKQNKTEDRLLRKETAKTQNRKNKKKQKTQRKNEENKKKNNLRRGAADTSNSALRSPLRPSLAAEPGRSSCLADTSPPAGNPPQKVEKSKDPTQ